MKWLAKRYNSSFSILKTLTVLSLAAVVSMPSAHADGAGNADIQENGCMQDNAGFNLGCQANDVNLGVVTNIIITDPCTVEPGDTVTFSGDFAMNLTAQARHDVGLWFSNDGDPNADGALTGSCTAVTPAYAPDPSWIDLDGVNDDPNGVIQDTCGDIDANHNPLMQNFELTVVCVDDDGDGMLDLPYCSSWRQPGANELCVSPLDAFPGSPSKCKCEPGFSVNVPVPFSGTLEVIKELVPTDDDGLFNLQIDGMVEATDVGDMGTTGPILVSAGISTDIPPIGEDLTASETAGTGTSLSDYDSTIGCVDEDNDTDDPGGLVFVEPDDAWVCTITNTRKAKLALIKEVTKDNGGTAAETEWTLSAAGPTPISGAGGVASTEVTFGTYTLSESGGPAGYTASTWVCTGGSQTGSQVTIGAGDDVTCTITNDDQPPSLTLTKVVVNNNGGTAVTTDFTLSAAGPTPISGAGGASSDATFSAGAYALSETGPDGYEASSWSCTGGTQNGDQITVGLGESASCSITNDDISPTLTVIKTVVNDNGGTAAPDDFNLTVDGGAVLSSATNDFAAGAHTAAETLLAGYAAGTWGGDCAADGSITLALDQDATCTIINDDIAPMLTLIKTVTNDDGGGLGASDFPLFISGNATTSGTAVTLSAGGYVASETTQTGYAAGNWTGDCDADGNVSLSVGQSKTCTINNDDIAPTLKLVKVVDNGANPGGTAVTDDWTLSATAANPNHGRNFSNAGGAGVFETVFANASYDLSESTVAGYQLKTDWSCTGGTLVGSTLTLGLDADVTCTIANEAQGMVELLKLTNGLESAMVWNFTLDGPGVDESDSSPPTTVDFGGVKLIPGSEYTLCETGIPAGWTLEWQVDTDGDGNPDTIIPMVAGVNNDPVGVAGYSRVYDPNYVAPPGTFTNDTRCVNFVVDVGETLAFQIDNQFPGGEPRTIGFWKNWNTCTGGNQRYNAANNGGPAEGWFILDDLLNNPGFTIGELQLMGDDCVDAVNILDKREINGRNKKMANDAAYGLAAQLLAAQVNLSAGAETCQAVVDAVNAGQTLLLGIQFDGTGGYLKGKNGGALRAEANALASTLDEYNNGNLCSP